MKPTEKKKAKKRPAFRVKAAELRDKAKKFCADRKSSNELVDVLSFVGEASDESEEDVASLQAGVSAILKMTTFVLDQGLAPMEGGGGAEEIVAGDENDADACYRLWLRDRLWDATNVLLTLLEDSASLSIREAALVAVVKIIAAEGRRMRIAKTTTTKTTTTKCKHLINERAFNALVKTLISSKRDMSDVLPRFEEYVENVDVVHCLLLFLHDQVKRPEKAVEGKTLRNEMFWQNFFSLLELIKMAESKTSAVDEWLIPLNNSSQQLQQKQQPDEDSASEAVTKTAMPEDRRLFSSLWTEFLQSPLPPSVFKKSLVLLGDRVMPFMTSPLTLTDFLIKSFDMGGVVSILALNGIFILIHRYNLEYPHFYKKLYSLLTDATIFAAKYRARFFFLVDLFLTSTHIPAYLVCAFAKRLSRLALLAPPNGILVILSLVRNLLLNHPNAQILVHCPDGATCLEDDPFESSEEDPALCRAMESSLWEVASLQNHYLARISKLASALLTQPIQGLEQDLSAVLEQTEDDLFEKESKSKFRHVAVNHVTPQGLFDVVGDAATKSWVPTLLSMDT